MARGDGTKIVAGEMRSADDWHTGTFGPGLVNLTFASNAQLMPGLIRHQGRNIRMSRVRGKHATLRIACVHGELSRIGKVRMLISKRPRGPWKKCIAIVTNETGLRPRQIVAIYEMRRLIEVLFKQLHQDLGLGDYQMLHRQAILRHLHLCCLAHLLLTHRCLAALGANAPTPPTRPSR